MKVDTTITISVIIGIVATLPQIVVAIINSVHDSKVAKNQMYHLKKREVLEEFINTSINCFYKKDWESNKEFLKALYKLQIYFKSADKNFIKTINAATQGQNGDEFIKNSFFAAFIKLSGEIKKR